jgi:hypothetical protein
MEFSKKQKEALVELFRKALNARNVDLASAMQRCAKWWGIDRKDEDYLDALEGNNKARINYILSFDMNDGEDANGDDFEGNYTFLKSLIKAKIIAPPRGLEDFETEEQPARKQRVSREEPKARNDLRPPKDVSDSEIRKALKQYGNINAAAKALQTRWSTINRRFDADTIDELCGRNR